jgi:peroxiredoxin
LDESQKPTVQIIAVSVDDREHLQMMVDRVRRESSREPKFTLLSDPGHRVIDRYGLLNDKDPRGIPHPSTYVIDKRGIVRWKFTEVNYKIRPTNEMILAALAQLQPQH